MRLTDGDVNSIIVNGNRVGSNCTRNTLLRQLYNQCMIDDDPNKRNASAK